LAVRICLLETHGPEPTLCGVRSCPPGSAWFQPARSARADRAHNL